MIVVLGSSSYAAEQTNRDLTLRIEPMARYPAYSLFVSGQRATNFVLESSVDLRGWQTVYQAFGWPRTNAVYEIAPAVEGRSYAFWRAVPGEALEVRRQRWLDKEPAEYTFRLRRMFSFWEGGVRGTVRIRRGAVVEVTDAVDDRSNQPITQPDLSRFLTITQVFDEIRLEFVAGSEHVQVKYDSTGLVPSRVLIDRRISFVDDESVIEATDLVIVEP